MNELFKLILSEKGRDSNRALLLALTLYVAWQVTQIDKRVAVLETSAKERDRAALATNHLVRVP